jgi:hypothetical protein
LRREGGREGGQKRRMDGGSDAQKKDAKSNSDGLRRTSLPLIHNEEKE